MDFNKGSAEERIEAHRIEFEKLYGPTPNRRYTTQLSPLQQLEMSMVDPIGYVRGFPPYLLAYFREMISDYQSNGRLDDLPDALRKAFVETKGTLIF